MHQFEMIPGDVARTSVLHCIPSHCYPNIEFCGTHLLVNMYTWAERNTLRVKCLAQEHNCYCWQFIFAASRNSRHSS